jgi:hypothetical protein
MKLNKRSDFPLSVRSRSVHGPLTGLVGFRAGRCSVGVCGGRSWTHSSARASSSTLSVPGLSLDGFGPSLVDDMLGAVARWVVTWVVMGAVESTAPAPPNSGCGLIPSRPVTSSSKAQMSVNPCPASFRALFGRRCTRDIDIQSGPFYLESRSYFCGIYLLNREHHLPDASVSTSSR